MEIIHLISKAIMIWGVYMGIGTCKECAKTDMCSCEFDDGSGKVDLTSLGNKDGTPRFKDVECDEDDWYYSYNPCGGFEEKQCSDVALCGLTDDKSQTLPLGKADSVKFKYDSESGNVQAGYLIVGTPIMSAEIEMICDTSACEPQFVPFGREESFSFKMQLTSICACPGMCTATGPTQGCSSKGLSVSTGTFILIGFLGCLVVYLAIGVSYQRFKKKASGKDLIPNRSMWISLKVHIASGFALVFCNVGRRDVQ